MNISHSGFIASKGIDGWYETIMEDEVIKFERPVNGFLVESLDSVLAIKIDNNEDNIWYVSAGEKEGMEGLKIKQIQVLNPAGTQIRWKALTY